MALTNFSAESKNATLNSTEFCINEESWGSAITTVAAAVITVGNVLVILVLIKFPSRRFRPLNWFIVQMAVADFGVGIVLLWIGTFTRLLLDQVTLTSSIFVYGALASTTSTSTLGVTFIAVDRYFYIIKHSRYKSIVTRRKVALSIALAFVVPFFIFIGGPALGWNCISTCNCRLYNLNPTEQYCFGAHCSQMMTPFRRETVLIGGISLVTLLVVSIALYTRIFYKVHFQSNCVIHRTRRKSELRMIKTMLIVLTGFVVTAGPLAVCCLVSYAYNARQLHFVMRILVIISTLNSILNPFFYFWRIPDMYSNLRYMCRGCLVACMPCWISPGLPPRKTSANKVGQGGQGMSKRQCRYSETSYYAQQMRSHDKELGSNPLTRNSGTVDF